jgi:hypothetical protein
MIYGSRNGACRLTLKSALFLLWTCLFAAHWTSAQTQSSASLNGTVKDASGAVIPDASAILKNEDTGVIQKGRTNGAGVYNLMNIAPGRYTLQIEKTGFTSELQPSFALQVNQTATIDFALKVGSTTSEVVVSAQAINLETSTAELGAVVGAKEVQDLPLNGRNFTELLLLTPGASPINPLQNQGGAPGAIGSFVYPAINGQSNRSNMFLLDGVNNYGAGSDTNAVQPTIDDVLEFKVQSHNDEAEFGQVLGGIVNLVTKSGTNEFHGDLWEFFRNDGLDASNFFNSQKTPLHQNQFGATVGGPVLLPHYNGRNKTFFYGSYEGFRQTTSSPLLYLVPTPAQESGDFSAVGSQIYNPYSVQVAPDGSYTNTPFLCDASGNASPVNPNGTQSSGTPCNMIPSSLINSTALTYAKELYPAPKDVGQPGFNGQDNAPTSVSADQMSVRIDQQLGARDRVFFRYTASWQSDVSSGGVEGNQNAGSINNYNIAANWVHTFATGLAQFTFGRVYGKDTVSPIWGVSQQDVLSKTDFAPNFVNHDIGGTNMPLFPTVGINGYVNDSNFDSGGTYSDIYEYRSDDSKTLGRHLLKFGGSIATDNTSNQFLGSVDVFDVIQTSSGSAANGGDAFASMMLGLPTYAELDNVDAFLHSGKIFGVYGEDQWKVTDKLTINFGLRYDVTDWPREGRSSDHSDITGNMNLNNGTYVLQKPAPACSSTQGAPCIPGGTLPANVSVSPNGRIIQNTYDNIQPRFGFAYRLNDKTVIRGAYGRFFDNWAAVIGFGANFTESWPNVAYLSASNLNNPNPTATANDPLGIGSAPLLPSATPFEQSDGFLDPNLQNPYSNQFNLGFQREWAGNSVLSVNYVGALNQREMLQLTGNAALTPGPGDPQLRAPYPYIQPQQGYVRSIGNSNYNALQISSQGRSSNGLTYTLAYTYSKDINIGCDTYSSFCDVQDPYHPENDRGIAGWDVTNLFSGAAVYELPFGNGHTLRSGNRVANYLIGGWQLNTIVSLSNGAPYDVQAPYQIANTNNISGAERPNIVGDVHAGATKLNPINTAAFALPAPFTFGDMGRNSLRADWRRNIDLSVFKSFPITETKKLEFRFEAFNLTNTPVFSAPDNNITDPNFGVVSSTANVQRELQLAAKFYF